MAKKEGVQNKVYLVRCDDGTKKVTIPENWKVTYGALHGGASKGYDGCGNVLRIYESAEKQRAIFTNVKAFRDLSIPVQKLVKNKEEIAKILHEKGKTISEGKNTVTELWVDEYDIEDGS